MSVYSGRIHTWVFGFKTWVWDSWSVVTCAHVCGYRLVYHSLFQNCNPVNYPLFYGVRLYTHYIFFSVTLPEYCHLFLYPDNVIPLHVSLYSSSLLVLEYFYLTQLHTSTPLHPRDKSCTLHSTNFIESCFSRCADFEYFW